CNEVVTKLNDVWSKFSVSTCHRGQSVRKIENFNKEYINLNKSRKKKKISEKQREKTDKFNLKLNQLFDIINNGKYDHLSNSCKEFYVESKKTMNCFQLADDILKKSAILDNVDDSIEYEEHINGNEL
ncbi:hypothetical protein PV326_001452, partial [Microctonus aethiopoides]